MNDAIAQHNDIREAVREARLYAVASPVWWLAVNDAIRTCRDHMARYEHGRLANFSARADLELRNELGRQWAAFTSARARDAQPRHAAPGSDLQHTPVSPSRHAQPAEHRPKHQRSSRADTQDHRAAAAEI
jgi:hypothetical protein